MIAGVFLSKNPPLGAYGLLKFFEFFFFGFYVFSHLKKGKDLGFIVLLFSIGILGESFLAIFQFLKQGSLNSLFYYFGERTFTSYTPGIANVSLNGRLFLRPYGTFPHPNVIAAYLLIGLTLIIFNLKFLILNQFLSFNFKRIIFLLALFIGTIALFLTMSRVAIILWLIIFSFFLFRAIKAKSYFKFIFAIYFLLFAIFSLSPIRYRFSEVNIKDESVLKRQETIIQSVEVFKKNPIFGTGVNNYLINVKPL
ncbi:MAG: O-antigen ligase family protein [Patescibacteria group bacterium]|nr:O-antigen ligase family protein [Patescibacteria group bacterium]